MDTVSKEKRSETMSAVKSKNSVMERLLKNELKKLGFNFNTNVAKLTGKPDIVYKKEKLVIFLDSCFWHGCKKHCRIPKTNRKYWINKFNKNIERDKKINKYYRNSGWQVFRFWEHKIKNNSDKAISKINKYLTQ